MPPILQTESAVIGFLPDAFSCKVTEERNGIYELELTYPVSDPMFSYLAIDKFIKAKPNDKADNQFFRIYEIAKPINGIVTVSAEHISYALSHYPVNGVSGSYTTSQAISALLTNANGNLPSSHGFSVSTTGMSAVKAFSFEVGTVRSALGGTEGSILNTYGEFDRVLLRCLKFASGLEQPQFLTATPTHTCCIRHRRSSRALPLSDFAAENSPPDCFFNAAHPLRLRIPCVKNQPALTDNSVFCVYFSKVQLRK